MKHVHRGSGSVRPYLCGPTGLIAFIQTAFDAELIESNEGVPTLLKLGDSFIGSRRASCHRTSKPGSALSTSMCPTSTLSTLAPWGRQRGALPRRKTSHTTSGRPASWMLAATRGGYRPTLVARRELDENAAVMKRMVLLLLLAAVSSAGAQTSSIGDVAW